MRERETALAVDIGGTKIASGIVDDNGELLDRYREPTDDSSDEALYQQVLRLAVRARAAAATEPIACGIGTGGPARDSHRLLSPLNIAVWSDFPLQERLQVDLGLPVHIDNDAKALALAEGWKGAAAGVQNFIGMVVSTG
ncbi:MAG: ROK family protein, partial [Acidimicrobiales bacterium]